MTLILENVDTKLLQVIESLKGLKSDLEIIKEPNIYEAMRECEEIAEEIRRGKRVPYESWSEAKEALLRD